jgi:beta-galactosidase
MEALEQHFGFMLYRTTIPGTPGMLSIEGLHDYAVVMVDGSVAGHLDRRLGESQIELRSSRSAATLDILVENCGRINYGPRLADERKGITGSVRFNGDVLAGWRMYRLPLESVRVRSWNHAVAKGPAFYRGKFDVEEPADTFLDTWDLGKGVLWVNGHNAGRFWNIGPQRALYIPGVWLHRGHNEVIALDLFARTSFPHLESSQ